MRNLPIPLLVFAIGMISAASAANNSGTGVPPSPPAINVSVTEVDRGPIRAWIRTEGTARAVRREILQFGRSGKVIEIGVDDDGEALREGSVVYGPSDGKAGQGN